MERISNRFWRLPNRLSPTRARLLIGLSVAMFLIAAVGIVIYDGLERVVYATLFLAIGLSNLGWGAGSLLPEARGGKTARSATLPLGIVTLLAVLAWLALQAAGRR
jgi:hypothetical protein